MNGRTIANAIALTAALSTGILFAWETIASVAGRDVLPPTIEVSTPELTMSISDPTSQAMNGVRAFDATDGDVSDMVVIGSTSGFHDDGSRTVEYVAFDKSGNSSRAWRKIRYSDYESPKFELKRPLRFPTGSAESDVLSTVGAWDCLDGDLSSKIELLEGTTLNSALPSRKKATFVARNAEGDESRMSATVEFYDPSDEGGAPRIVLKDFLTYVPLGSEFDPTSFVEKVSYRGTDYEIVDGIGTFAVDSSKLSGSELDEFRESGPTVNGNLIRISNAVDEETPGFYEVTYEISDANGIAGRATLVVAVEEEP